MGTWCDRQDDYPPVVDWLSPTSLPAAATSWWPPSTTGFWTKRQKKVHKADFARDHFKKEVPVTAEMIDLTGVTKGNWALQAITGAPSSKLLTNSRSISSISPTATVSIREGRSLSVFRKTAAPEWAHPPRPRQQRPQDTVLCPEERLVGLEKCWFLPRPDSSRFTVPRVCCLSKTFSRAAPRRRGSLLRRVTSRTMTPLRTATSPRMCSECAQVQCLEEEDVQIQEIRPPEEQALLRHHLVCPSYTRSKEAPTSGRILKGRSTCPGGSTLTSPSL